MALKLSGQAPKTEINGVEGHQGQPPDTARESAMRATRQRRQKSIEGGSRIVAIADAHLAAATAERLAAGSSRFAVVHNVGHDDAHEVRAAAHRAHMAALEAEQCETDEAAWAAARLAWAAVVSAREADARISEAVVDRLMDS
jgi:hypothetical protein